MDFIYTVSLLTYKFFQIVRCWYFFCYCLYNQINIKKMKTITNFKSKVNRSLVLLFTMCMSFFAFAQDTAGGVVTKENTSTSTTTTEWYADPMYLIGGGILLLIIIALFVRGGRRGEN